MSTYEYYIVGTIPLIYVCLPFEVQNRAYRPINQRRTDDRKSPRREVVGGGFCMDAVNMNQRTVP